MMHGQKNIKLDNSSCVIDGVTLPTIRMQLVFTFNNRESIRNNRNTKNYTENKIINASQILRTKNIF